MKLFRFIPFLDLIYNPIIELINQSNTKIHDDKIYVYLNANRSKIKNRLISDLKNQLPSSNFIKTIVLGTCKINENNEFPKIGLQRITGYENLWYDINEKYNICLDIELINSIIIDIFDEMQTLTTEKTKKRPIFLDNFRFIRYSSYSYEQLLYILTNKLLTLRSYEILDKSKNNTNMLLVDVNKAFEESKLSEITQNDIDILKGLLLGA